MRPEYRRNGNLDIICDSFYMSETSAQTAALMKIKESRELLQY